MNLRAEIILIFLGIMLVTISVASTLFYFSSKSFLLEEIYQHLQSIAEAKQQRLNEIIEVRQEQIALLQNRELLSIHLNNYLHFPTQENLFLLNKSSSQVKNFVRSFKNVHVLDTNGIVLSSSDISYVGKDYTKNESFTRALKGRRAINAFHYDKDKRLIFDMAGIIYHHGQPNGVIIAETYADEVIAVVMDFTGLGETGETTLVKEDKDGNAIYVTPTRHFPVYGVLMNLERNNKYDSFKALEGDEGLHTDIIDYREKEVIAATRYIRKLHWGLTTKIDKEEAYQPIVALRNKIIMVTIVLFALTILLAYYFAGYIIKPIRQISTAAKKIAEGDYTQRVKSNKKNELGEMAFFFNKMTDKLMKAHKKLNVKIDALNASNDNLQRFSYVVSHDLKSPLNNFIGLLNILRKNYTPVNDAHFHQLIEMMIGKSNQMKGLIDGILHYSKAGTEQATGLVDLNQTIKEVLETIQVPDNIKVVVENLPSVLINKTAITQVFLNLLSNSVKFNDKEEGLILVGCKNEDDYYKFYVQDNGPGISAENQQKVFDIFNKVNTNPNVDSSGVGLSIVKKIIEVNGGRIWVDSEVGKGSTFYFTLPVKEG